MAGMAAGSSDIPVDHLDYGYIEKLSNASELEKILKVLRSAKKRENKLYCKLKMFNFSEKTTRVF